MVEFEGFTGAGQGVSTDIIEAAARAYVRALSVAVARSQASDAVGLPETAERSRRPTRAIAIRLKPARSRRRARSGAPGGWSCRRPGARRPSKSQPVRSAVWPESDERVIGTAVRDIVRRVITYKRMAGATRHGPARRRPDPLDPRDRRAREGAARGVGLSLRDLAERSGVSAPMLSQVERGETSPTLTVAARIAAGLELRLSQLLRLDEGGAVTIVRAARAPARRQRAPRAQLRGADLAQPGQRAELSRHTLAPGGPTGAAGRPADARARQPRDRADRERLGRARLRRPASRARRGRLRDLRRRPATPLREPGERRCRLPGGRPRG